jgi:hypothetical protein
MLLMMLLLLFDMTVAGAGDSLCAHECNSSSSRCLVSIAMLFVVYFVLTTMVA